MKKTLTILSILFILLVPAPVYAHAFGQRYDLPIPLSYFMAGAAATVALSFVVIGLFLKGGGAEYRYPRFNLLSLPGVPLTSRIKALVAQVLSVSLFLLVLATSFLGSDNPLANLSPTFVWIIWWVGMGYIAAIFGNLWMLINPWKALYEFAEWMLKCVSELECMSHAASLPFRLGRDARPDCVPVLCLAGECLSRLHRATLPRDHHRCLFRVYTLRRHAAVRQARMAALRRPVRNAIRDIRPLLAD